VTTLIQAHSPMMSLVWRLAAGQRVVAEDVRYRDRIWLATNRRWPPVLVEGLSAFLDLQSSKPAAVAR
jgi:hypothetical protein